MQPSTALPHAQQLIQKQANQRPATQHQTFDWPTQWVLKGLGGAAFAGSAAAMHTGLRIASLTGSWRNPVAWIFHGHAIPGFGLSAAALYEGSSDNPYSKR